MFKTHLLLISFNQELNMNNIQELKAMVKLHMNTWSEVSSDEIQFDRLSGFTNITYKVSHRENKLKPLVFKWFSNVQGLIERNNENMIFKKLSDWNIGPKCYFYDDRCRIEQFLEQGRHPTNQHLKSMELKKAIIARLFSYHEIRIPSLQNEQTFVDYFLSEEFLAQALKHTANREYTSSKKIIFQTISSYLTLEKFQQVRQALLPLTKIRMCHNDLNNHNVMLTNTQIYFIDYEYSRYNYISYDIANFLNESAIDYTVKQYPFFHVNEAALPREEDTQEICEAYFEERMKKTGQEHNEKELKLLCDQTYRCLGLCNFYWAIWSIMMDNNHTDFGYIEHGGKRLELFEKIYHEVKERKKFLLETQSTNDHQQ